MSYLLNRTIICSICKEKISIRVISNHLKTHNIQFLQYVKDNRSDFPNWHECENCGEITKKVIACSRTCMTKIRKSRTGKEAPRYGAKLYTDTIDKISKSRKEQGNFWEGKHHSIETKRKLSEYWNGKRTGKDNGMYGKTHTPEVVKKIFSHRPMNKFEEAVANLLTENGYKYTFQFFIVENEICKSYDFKIKGKPIIIETDGDFWHGNPDAKYHWKDCDSVIENDKLKEKMAKERGYNIIRIWESEFKKNPSILIEKLQNPIFI